MDILLIRHGIAQDREDFALRGQADELRELTPKGKRKMRDVALGLKKLVPSLHALASSPLVRAVQTADIVMDVYGQSSRVLLPALSPRGEREDVLEWLQQHPRQECLALIGHAPDLGALASWLLTGNVGLWLPLKKGGACLLKWDEQVIVGQGKLAWLLTASQLQEL
ncbi:phosphohistidine phosphatase SixA [Thioflexithrix psekupsensis]|uniref:Phosphohistidine phosphatase SixA n=1 Tax=Thioflexithrix psekupsensis TaxID=1570016 RepID=A0A251XAK3_9GAMM|nr:phosphohistidine phosphatase SixA [Thioflexithrix psekupsensis]OUD14967.1 phosphohistidine phosphatase SixA [Thioflexithrix psekupsensis]